MKFFIILLLLVGTVDAQNTVNSPFEKLRLGEDCQPDVLILKVKDHNAVAKIKQSLETRFPMAQCQFEAMFPKPKSVRAGKNTLGQSYVDISKIYQLKLSGSFDLWAIRSFLAKSTWLSYVEPKLIHHTTFTPNDAQIALQWQIGKIQAEQAWDINTGDSAFVVGIVDTGTDPNHDDLKGNVKHNTVELLDGIDNDGDGYVDNRLGWDFIDDDNNPDAVTGSWGHGVSVAGCAAAKTNNTTGVSSPAFNGKFLPVRVGSGSSVSYGFEGIVYAAEHGCKFINCSWGGNFSSLYEQDVVNYVTINLERLIIAAAGNNWNDVEFYPAAYDHVIAVAATENNDQKAGFSCFGNWVDLCAPGASVYSTTYGNNYSFLDGTSFASPICAGSASLVNSTFPALSPIQVGALLKATCTNINSMNPGLIGQLGSGRLNLYQAVQSAYPSPAIELESFVLTDYKGDVFSPSDTADLTISYINYLAPTGNAVATLSSSSPYVTFINNNINYGVIATLTAVDNNTNPWQIKISSTAPQNTTVTLAVTLTDGTYSVTHNFDMIINRDYINVTANEIGTTITSKGGIGFNDFTSQQQGMGFVYPYTSGGSNLLYEGGFMVGTSSKISDIVRSSSGTNDVDFSTLDFVYRTIPGFSDFDVTTRYNDDASASPLPVEILQNTYAWNLPGHEKYVMMEYFIKNQGASTLNNLYAGIYCDWDISDYTLNKAQTSLPDNLGYCFYDDGGTQLFAGTRLLYPSTGFSHYGFDHATGGAGGLDITDDFTTAEKYNSMSNMRATAGGTSGTDVSDVVSAGPFNIAPGATQRVVFALLAGDNLADFIETSDSAASHFASGVVTQLSPLNYAPEFHIYPNPANGYQHIMQSHMQIGNLEIYDVDGRLQQKHKITSSDYIIDISNLSSGVYVYRFVTEGLVKQYKVVKF